MPAATSQNLRISNLSLVLRTILSAESPISRAQVAQRTDLTRATVSRLVSDLVDWNLLTELPALAGATGRPSVPLTASSLTYVCIGLEINIHYLSVVVLDLSGMVAFSAIKSGNYRNSTPKVVFNELETLLSQWQYPASTRIVGVTLCVPGLVDKQTSTIITAPNLGWEQVKTDTLPIFGVSAQKQVVNEADASAFSFLYERPGAPSSEQSFVYMSGEVGIGASIAINGELFTGKNGWAGEIGHMCIDPNGPQCGCGANGCLEQYAGEASLLRNFPAGTSVNDLVMAFKHGSSIARDAVDLASTSLGRALANALNLLDLDLVILGGNLSILFPYMENLLSAEIQYRVLSSRWSNLRIRTSKHGQLTAARGACLMAFHSFLREPVVGES
ncbi:ROK family protein [Trueperella pyogenes]|uniref:ROK family protein n=1 Tax=Trueperella pyogenes TaxID=1661 RepID=UPI0009B1FA09|nr:ROK family protein [Trueperella pyogenes]OQD32960.1 hypothetical protein B1R42_09440 [Trueperella pyogenes]